MCMLRNGGAYDMSLCRACFDGRHSEFLSAGTGASSSSNRPDAGGFGAGGEVGVGKGKGIGVVGAFTERRAKLRLRLDPDLAATGEGVAMAGKLGEQAVVSSGNSPRD